MNEQKNKDNFWSFLILRRPVAWIISFAIVIGGIFAIQSIPREIQPEINIPFVSVATFLPGANPEDVESLITDPLEKEIAAVSDIKNLTSSSGLGLSTILIEFDADSDLDEKVNQVKDKIDLAQSQLPSDATDPQVAKAEPNATSIVTFSIIGDRPLSALSEVAEEVADQLEQVSGVSKAIVVGNQEKVIQIKIDQEKAENLGLALTDLARIVEFSDLNVPIGVISTDQINYGLRIDNSIKTLDQILNLPISDQILLRDIADTEIALSDQSVISKLSVNGQESKPTVSVQVFKETGANIIAVVDKAKAVVAELNLDSDIKITVSNDNSEFIRTDLGILTSSGWQTIVIIVVILFLALGLAEGILAAISIPLTLLTTFMVMQAMGLTINSLTLFSLVIALGILVDTAIVIMEGINENLKKGMNATDAAIMSVENYKWPLIAGTMTTVFAFFPMLLVSGILGEFLKSLPLTISAALLSSLVISLTIIPAISTKFLGKHKGKEHKSLLEGIFHKMEGFFSRMISKILSRRSYRFLTILIATIAFALSMALPISGALKVEMFPQTDFRFFIVNIETPKGLVLSETEKITSEIEETLYTTAEIESFLTIIGSGQSQVATDIVTVGQAGASNQGNITINLVPKEQREKTSYEVAEDLRTEFEKIKDVKVTIQEFTEGPPSDSPVALSVTGSEIQTLEQIAEDVKGIISKIDGTENITDDLNPGLSEFKFTLDRDLLAAHALNGAQVAGEIRSIIQGIEVMEVKIDSEDYKIIAKYDLPSTNNIATLSLKDLENFQVQSPKGYAVNLSQIAEFDLGEGFSSINHDDQDRIIKIRSDLRSDKNAVQVTTELQEKLASYKLPEGYQINFGGDTEEIEESFRELFMSMGIAVLLIGFTLVLMFNSLSQPFVILLTLPLSLIGVLPGLALVGLNLSFPAFLGVVALSGVVVNDAIVLIDRINQNLKAAVPLKQAIAESASSRLQPIIMTSITTIAGILPLAYTNEFWAGLGFSLVFGLIASTVLTLVVIPVSFFMFTREKK